MNNATLNLHGAQRITVTRLIFDEFTTTRLAVIWPDGSKMEIDCFSEAPLTIEDIGTEDHRKEAA